MSTYRGKLTMAHYQAILEAIKKIPKAAIDAHREEIKNDPRIKDLAKRMRWDMLFATKQEQLINDIYLYAHDEHIDNALKHIMEQL